MHTLLYIILVLAVVVLMGGITLITLRYEKAISEYRKTIEEWKNNYHALEIGRDEESDAYEQQFLSFREQVQALHARNDRLREELTLCSESVTALMNSNRNLAQAMGSKDVEISALRSDLEIHEKCCLPILEEL